MLPERPCPVVTPADIVRSSFASRCSTTGPPPPTAGLQVDILENHGKYLTAGV
jgi:hypothetical protein